MRIRTLGIIIKESKVVLVHRNVNNKEYFVFPGGGVEEEETLEQAVIREVYEEASIQVKVEKLLYIIKDENSEHYFYFCTYLSGELKKENEEYLETSDPKDLKIPSWNKIDNLSNKKILPLEVRDWLIEDFKNNFTNPPRTFSSLISERRLD